MENKRSADLPDITPSQDNIEHAESPKRKRPRLDNGITPDAPMLNADARQDTLSPISLTHDENENGVTIEGNTTTKNRRSSNNIILNLRSSHAPLPQDTLELQVPAPNTAPDPADEPVNRSSSTSPTVVIPHPSRTPSNSPPVVELLEADSEELMDEDGVAIEFEDQDTAVLDALNSFPYADQYGLLEALHVMTKAVSEDAAGEEIYVSLEAWMDRWNTDAQVYRDSQKSAILNNTQFWVDLANLMSKFLTKKTTNGLGRKPRSMILDLLGHYVEICADLIQSDLVELTGWREGSSNPSYIVFLKHLRNIESTLQPWRVAPVFKMFEIQNSSAVRRIQEALVVQFINSEMSSTLLNYATVLAQQPTLWKHFCSHLSSCSKAISNAVIILSGFLTLQEDQNTEHEFILKALEVSELITQSLLTETGTLTASIPVDASTTLAISACAILQGLDMLDSTTAKRFVKVNIDTIDDELKLDDLARLARDSSKLELMLQFLTQGRMELRIASVATLGDVLVHLWKDYSNQRQNGKIHPLLRAISQWILEHKVIDRLLSAESHPQLLMRSANIFGFLVITSTWTKEITDSFWSRIHAMQDQRLVTAALTAMQDNFQYLDDLQSQYFVEKIKQVPLSAFTKEMVNFFEKLMEYVTSQDACTETVTELCLHILGQIGDSPIQLSTLHTAAWQTLKKLSHDKLSFERRQKLYSDCLAFKGNVSSQAYGRVHAIVAVLEAQRPADVIWLVEERDVLSSLTVLASHASDLNLSSSQRDHRLYATICLLNFILRRVPQSTFQPSDEKLFMQYLVGDLAADHGFRNLAWSHFKALIPGPGAAESPFINNIIDIYLPRITPSIFNTGLFEFVESVVSYEHRRHQATTTAEDEIITPPLSEVIWHMAFDAPHNTIESTAIAFLSKTFVEAPWIVDAPITLIGATHTALVNRSVKQLEEAAANLRTVQIVRQDDTVFRESCAAEIKVKNSDQTASASAEYQPHRQHFGRTVNFLEKLVQDVRQRKSLNDQATESRLPSPLLRNKSEPSNADAAILKFQPFTIGKQGDVQDLRVSASTTFAQLTDELRKRTGFAKFKIVHCGKPLDLDSSPDHSAASLAGTGLLIVRDLGGTTATGEAGPRITFGSSAAERAVSAHLDTLVAFLNLDAQLSGPVYELLIRFPPHAKVRDLVMLESPNLAELFPIGQHFSTIYSFSCIRRHLTIQLSTGSPDENFLLHGIRALTGVLVAEQFSDIARSQEAACFLVDTLVLFLKERPLSSDVSAFLADQKLIASRLFDMLNYSQAHPETRLGLSGYPIYAALLEAALRGREIWNALTSWADRANIHQWLWTSPSAESILNLIKLLANDLPTNSCVKTMEFASFYWEMVSSMIERLPQSAPAGKYVLQAAANMFEEHIASTSDEATLRHYLQTWSTILAQHTRSETPGQGFINHLVLGLVRLVTTCVSYLRAFSKPLPAQELAVLLLDQYLFPDVQPTSDTHQPILDPETRKHMYTLLLSLCEHQPTYLLVSSKLSALLAHEASSPLRDFNININSWLRSMSGYSGLRNLTNTCYMNSLMTQLFMNVQFRNYMLSSTIVPKAQYDIMTGIQELFARMQGGTFKFTDTTAFARAIQPYDAEHIDVTIQMDVDEFYNLLFDRLENEMPDDEAKRQLRSFWGGNLVTQIKSMDCEHVSERSEPFLAIQCDVKGKLNLAESLQAYVEGDVMEGDNKYKCESCDNRMVNAIKRSCPQSLPDNLIFHLKRFDFDLTTFQRSKINDHFEFPTEINMTPYTLEQLSNPNAQQEADMFELVGVLVHSGTAETGHYYSYIRLPYENSQGKDFTKWAEFNDTEVTEFDPNRIAEQCFGGLWEDIESRLRYPKPNSAYMLFYRRVTSTDAQAATVGASPTRALVSMPAAPSLAATIQEENHALIRRYCLYDPVHAHFTKSFTGMLKHFDSGVCSTDHQSEKEILQMSLRYVVFVAARVKGAADVEALLQLVHKTTSVCSECTLFVLQWLTNVDQANLTSDMLLGCPVAKARQAWAELIASMMSDLRRMDPESYGIDSMNFSPTDRAVPGDGVLFDVVNTLQSSVRYLGRSLRVWDEYFELFAVIASLGLPEVKTLLSNGIFRDCLELICHDNANVSLLGLRNQETRATLKKTKRPPSYVMLTRFLYQMMLHLDLFGQPARSIHEQFAYFDTDTNKYPILADERQVVMTRLNGRLSFFCKLVEAVNQSEWSVQPWWPGELIKLIVRNALPNPAFIHDLGSTLAADINEYYPDAAGLPIQAGLAFCQACPAAGDADAIFRAITHSAQQLPEYVTIRRNSMGTVKEPDYLGGECHLDFFQQLSTLQEVACSSVDDNGVPPYLASVIVHFSHCAPPILIYDNYSTRQKVCLFLDRLIFDEYPHEVDENDDISMRLTQLRCEAVRILMKTCNHWAVQAQAKGCPKPWAEHIEKVMHECAKWINKLMSEESEAYAVFMEPGDEALLDIFDRAKFSFGHWREEDDWNFGEDTMMSEEEMLSDVTETEDGILE